MGARNRCHLSNWCTNAETVRKIRALIKIKSALPPPPPQKNPKYPPPLKRVFYGHGLFLQKERIFPGVHKLTHPFRAPELRTKILRTRGFFWNSACLGKTALLADFWHVSCRTDLGVQILQPRGPSRTKTLRDSELLRRSIFTTPPQIYYAVNPSLRGKTSVIPRKWCPDKVRRFSKSLCDSKFTTQSKFTIA